MIIVIFLFKSWLHKRSTLFPMMMILKAGSLAFTPPGDMMSEVASRCLPYSQLRVNNLFKVAMRWLEVDLNLRPSGCKAQIIPLHHRSPLLFF